MSYETEMSCSFELLLCESSSKPTINSLLYVAMSLDAIMKSYAYQLTFIQFFILHYCRVDSPTREVTKAEMRALESSYGVPVLTTANVKRTEASRYLPRSATADPLHVSVALCSVTSILNMTP